jgi:hypothetical protein
LVPLWCHFHPHFWTTYLKGRWSWISCHVIACYCMFVWIDMYHSVSLCSKIRRSKSQR